MFLLNDLVQSTSPDLIEIQVTSELGPEFTMTGPGRESKEGDLTEVRILEVSPRVSYSEFNSIVRLIFSFRRRDFRVSGPYFNRPGTDRRVISGRRGTRSVTPVPQH